MLSLSESSGYFLKNRNHVRSIYRKAINLVLCRFPMASEIRLLGAACNSPLFVLCRPNVTLKNIDRYIFKYSFWCAMAACSRSPFESCSEYYEELEPARCLKLFTEKVDEIYPLLSSEKWCHWNFIFTFGNCKSRITLKEFLNRLDGTKEGKVLKLLFQQKKICQISAITRLSSRSLEYLISNICRAYLLALLDMPYEKYLTPLGQKISFAISKCSRNKLKVSPGLMRNNFLMLSEPLKKKLVVQTWRFDVAYKVLQQCILEKNSHYLLAIR